MLKIDNIPKVIDFLKKLPNRKTHMSPWAFIQNQLSGANRKKKTQKMTLNYQGTLQTKILKNGKE